MWDKISADLHAEENKSGRLLSMSGKYSWVWKTATAAALVISIVSIALTTMNNNDGNSTTTAVEQDSFLRGYGNGFEQPAYDRQNEDVATSNSEETTDALLAEEEEHTNTSDLNSPAYSMKMLSDKEVSAIEYEIIGPDRSVEADPAMIQSIMEMQGKNILKASREGFSE
jgi:hypothetical protein